MRPGEFLQDSRTFVLSCFPMLTIFLDIVVPLDCTFDKKEVTIVIIIIDPAALPPLLLPYHDGAGL